MKNTIGLQVSPILTEIQFTLLESIEQPQFSKEGFEAIVYIFQSAMMDKMYDLQTSEKMEFWNMENMAEQCGKDLRNLIKTYTNIDTFEMFEA